MRDAPWNVCVHDGILLVHIMYSTCGVHWGVLALAVAINKELTLYKSHPDHGSGLKTYLWVYNRPNTRLLL